MLQATSQLPVSLTMLLFGGSLVGASISTLPSSLAAFSEAKLSSGLRDWTNEGGFFRTSLRNGQNFLVVVSSL